jgi:hypothetical protein
MTEQPHTAGRSWRGLFGRGPFGLLSACVVVAAVATFALDRYRVAERKRAFAAQLSAVNRFSIPAPDIARWRPTLLAPGTAAPSFRLVDVRTGGRVRLDESRGRRPVVLLLSSFG